MNDYMITTTVSVPFVAKALALAAMRSPAEYLADNAGECMRRAALVTSLVTETNEVLGAPALDVVHQPQAGHAILLAAPGLVGRRLPDGSTVRHSIDVTRFLLSTAKIAVSPGYSLGFDGSEIRVVFGSVGLKQTYAQAAAGELSSTLHRLATRCERSRPDVARLLHHASEALSDDTHDSDLFQPGRALIEIAFRRRITGALRSLLDKTGSFVPSS